MICGHQYHQVFLWSWVAVHKNSSCPDCRGLVSNICNTCGNATRLLKKIKKELKNEDVEYSIDIKQTPKDTTNVKKNNDSIK
jgi:hypothetical protein